LNDKDEVYYLYNELKEYIHGLRDYRVYTKMLNALKRRIDLTVNKMYVISFSINNDSIPLWQEYSSGDGYNLEFDIDGIIDKDTVFVVDMKGEVNSIQFIIYDTVEYRKEKIDELIKQYLSIYDSIRKSGLDSAKQKRLRDELNSYFAYKSLLTKNKTYYVEEEYRIVIIIPDQKTKRKCENYRIGKNMLVPYIKIKVKLNGYIKNIKMGPRNNLDIGLISLQRFLASKGIKDVKIEKSKIPLR
jgi:hypothetical protein